MSAAPTTAWLPRDHVDGVVWAGPQQAIGKIGWAGSRKSVGGEDVEVKAIATTHNCGQ